MIIFSIRKPLFYVLLRFTCTAHKKVSNNYNINYCMGSATGEMVSNLTAVNIFAILFMMLDRATGPDTHSTGLDIHSTGPDEHSTGLDTHSTGPDAHLAGPNTHSTRPETHLTGLDTH